MTLLRRAHSGYPVFSNFLGDIFSTADNGASFKKYESLPSVNIAENNDGFKIEFAAPGLSKEEFKINLDNNVLTVESEKKEVAQPKPEEVKVIKPGEVNEVKKKKTRKRKLWDFYTVLRNPS